MAVNPTRRPCGFCRFPLSNEAAKHAFQCGHEVHASCRQAIALREGHSPPCPVCELHHEGIHHRRGTISCRYCNKRAVQLFRMGGTHCQIEGMAEYVTVRHLSGEVLARRIPLREVRARTLRLRVPEETTVAQKSTDYAFGVVTLLMLLFDRASAGEHWAREAIRLLPATTTEHTPPGAAQFVLQGRALSFRDRLAAIPWQSEVDLTRVVMADGIAPMHSIIWPKSELVATCGLCKAGAYHGAALSPRQDVIPPTGTLIPVAYRLRDRWVFRNHNEWKHVERAAAFCAICFNLEDLTPRIALPCGHFTHHECWRRLENATHKGGPGEARCPTCGIIATRFTGPDGINVSGGIPTCSCDRCAPMACRYLTFVTGGECDTRLYMQMEEVD